MAPRIISAAFNSLYRLRAFFAGTLVFGIAFLVLLGLRAGWLETGSRPSAAPTASPLNTDRDEWMSIFQNGHKIGFSHTVLSRTETGFFLSEHWVMKLNVMGMVQNLQVMTRADLKNDLSLAGFEFTLSSGRFSFSARGSISDRVLHVTTETQSSPRSMKIPLDSPVFISAAILEAVRSAVAHGSAMSFTVFDPATLTREIIVSELAGRETILVDGTEHVAAKVSLTFKGVSQWVWISESGDILQQTGPLGIRLVRSDERKARIEDKDVALEDLAKLVSISSDRRIEAPETLIRAEFEIQGIPDSISTHLQGGRQQWDPPKLTVTRENLDILDHPETRMDLFQKFLAPTPLIQSDHPKIKSMAQEITRGQSAAPGKAEKLMNWVYHTIEKRPVIAVPDALSTFENRTGDCNEHAMLLAALARASGIPAQIECGLAYLNGRFYYHAWNRLYVGRWITADAAFGQFPADVTHLRLTSGVHHMTDLVTVIGNIRIKTISLVPRNP